MVPHPLHRPHELRTRRRRRGQHRKRHATRRRVVGKRQRWLGTPVLITQPHQRCSARLHGRHTGPRVRVTTTEWGGGGHAGAVVELHLDERSQRKRIAEALLRPGLLVPPPRLFACSVHTRFGVPVLQLANNVLRVLSQAAASSGVGGVGPRVCVVARQRRQANGQQPGQQ